MQAARYAVLSVATSLVDASLDDVVTLTSTALQKLKSLRMGLNIFAIGEWLSRGTMSVIGLMVVESVSERVVRVEQCCEQEVEMWCIRRGSFSVINNNAKGSECGGPTLAYDVVSILLWESSFVLSLNASRRIGIKISHAREERNCARI